MRPVTSPASRGARPNVPRVGSPGRRNIGDYTHAELMALARWIKGDTLLRTQADLISELAAELGFQRLGKRIAEALTAAAKAVADSPTG